VVEVGSAAFALVTAATNPAAAIPIKSVLIVCLLVVGAKGKNEVGCGKPLGPEHVLRSSKRIVE